MSFLLLQQAADEVHPFSRFLAYNNHLQGRGSHSAEGANAPPTFSAVNDYSDGSYGDDKVSRIRFKM